MFDSRQIEYIIAIAEEESLSKAADRLFISQSALSQQLTKLYQQGIPQLFYYENKKMKLTTAGKIYINGARAMLKVKANTEHQIEHLKNETTTAAKITIFIPSHFNEIFYRDILPGFRRKFPSVIISVTNNENIDTFNENAAEYDFLLLPQAYEISGYVYISLPSRSLGLVYSCSASMPLPVFMPQTDDPMYGIALSALNGWNISLPVYAFGSDLNLVLNQVKKGSCSCVLDYIYLADHPELTLYTRKKAFAYTLYLYCRSEIAESSLSRYMTELLLKSFGRTKSI